MEEKKPLNMAVLATALALLLVVVALVCLFLFGQSGSREEGIVLPTAQPETSVETTDPGQTQDSFVQVTTGNVVAVLKSLQKASYYQQSFEITVGSDTARAVRTVDLWVSGTLVYGEMDDGRKVKSVLTDGETAWLWYDVDPEPVSVTLDGSVQTEDLLGLPAFDYLDRLGQLEVSETDYLVLSDSGTQCIYVSADSDGQTERFWINLENGLLYQADALSDSLQVYLVKQTSYAQLAEEDVSFRGKFSLPDGSEPFTAAAGMRLR